MGAHQARLVVSSIMVSVLLAACGTGGSTPQPVDKDGDGVAVTSGDCDDANPAVRPGAAELCNGIDDNCDGEVDEGCAVHGDGVVTAGEECDDGNTVDGDGCSPVGVVSVGWTCDAAQPSVCTEVHGDGSIVGSEACDDGNTVDGDGCSALGSVEAGWTCDGAEPTVCLPACHNGVKDQDESDIDCGGTCGSTCGLGATCDNAGDCASAVCVGGACVACGPATALVFRTQPAGTTGGTAIAPVVEIAILDERGNIVESSSASVTLTLGPAPSDATLSGTTTVAATQGIAAFSDLSIDKAGVGYVLTATTSGLSPETSNAFDVTVGEATRLSFAVQPSSTTSTEYFSPSVAVALLDAGGNLVPTSSASVTAALGTSTIGATLSGTTTVAVVDGIATFADIAIDKAGAGYTLEVASPGVIAATSDPFDVGAGPAAQLVFTVQPTSTTGGTTLAPAVALALLDAGGNTAIGSSAEVSLAIGTNPAAGTLWGTTTVSAVNGTVVFSDVSIDKAGAGYQLTASTSGLSDVTSDPFDINVGEATHLAFTVQPTSTTGGQTISPAVEVTFLDAGDNVVTTSSATITVELGVDPVGGSLSGTTTVSATGGVASFNDLAIDKAGTAYTLTASAQGVAGASSGAFDVDVGAPAQLAFAVQPSNTVSTSVMSPAVEVEVLDAGGNLVVGSTASIDVAIGANPAGGSLTGNTTTLAVDGVAIFTNLAIDKAGVGYTLAASSSGLVGATSDAFEIAIGDAAALAFAVQPTSAASTAPISPAIEVTLLDAGGNTVVSSTASVSLAIASNPGGGTLSGTVTVPATNGVAIFSDLAIDRAGVGYTLAASSLGLADTTSDAFNISVGSATQLAFTVQPPDGFAGLVFPSTVEIAVRDAGGNLVPTSTADITIAIGTNPAGGTLSGTTALAAAGGLTTFADLAIDTAGTGYTLVASAPGLTEAVSDGFDIARLELQFAEPSRTVDESVGNMSVAVVINHAVTIPVTATFSVFGTASQPEDHDLVEGSVTIVPGDTSASIDFVVYDDPLVEGDERLGLAIQSSNVPVGAVRNTVVTIRDNESSTSGLVVEQVAAGDHHTCAIVSGALKCWGNNLVGELGDGTMTPRTTAVSVSGMSANVTAVAAGTAHTCAIVSGALKCWGYNYWGQLGTGSHSMRTTPGDVTGLSAGVTAVAAGASHTCAVASGALTCWGYNDYGQVGDGTKISSTTPVAVSGMSADVTSVEAGERHTCAIANSAVSCWGDNASGQLGDGTTTLRTTPVSVSGLAAGVTAIAAGTVTSYAIVDGGLMRWGSGASTPVGVTAMASGVTAVTTGTGHTCTIVDGGLWCWGANTAGQLGDGTAANQAAPVRVIGMAAGVTAVAAGGRHTCAIVDNTVRCWGDNEFGQLGDGNTTSNAPAPVFVDGLSSNVTAVAAGADHTCAIVNNGLECWGSNGAGKLGDGTYTARTAAVAVVGMSSGVTAVATGLNHTCAIANGALSCWGSNFYGQLGNGTTTGSPTPTAVSGMSEGVTAVAAGGDHACAVMNGALACWGDNSLGVLGDGTTTRRTTPVAVLGMSTGAGVVATARNHTCATANDALWCWGYNYYGELGDGSKTNSATPVAVSGMTTGVSAVAVGNTHSCAIAAGALSCWGDNAVGRLGDGTTTLRTTPVAVSGMSAGVTTVAAGDGHTCAIASGALRCWGDGSDGQLGIGSIWTGLYKLTPTSVVGMSTGVSALATGAAHTCAVVSGTLKCWGDNTSSQLGGYITNTLPSDVLDVFEP